MGNRENRTYHNNRGNRGTENGNESIGDARVYTYGIGTLLAAMQLPQERTTHDNAPEVALTKAIMSEPSRSF